MSKEFIDRGKVIQIETFDEPQSFWTISNQKAIQSSETGALITQSVSLLQTAKTTFGFLRLSIDATLQSSDTIALRLTTIKESVELRKSNSTIGLYINGDLLEDIEYFETQVTLQLVLNDERVGCFAIGKRIHTLANRLKIASFDEQPYQFEVHTVMEHGSTVNLKEIVYESVTE